MPENTMPENTVPENTMPENIEPSNDEPEDIEVVAHEMDYQEAKSSFCIFESCIAL